MADFDRCVMILVDGSRADVFQQMMADGELPNCQALFGDRGGARSGTTAMPSVSGPAHLPPITGCYPGRSNIPGIRWFDRERYAGSMLQPGRFRSYMSLNKTQRMNREVDPKVPSIWESFPDGGAMFCWFTRGLAPGNDLTRGEKVKASVKGFLTRNWEAGDNASGALLLKEVDSDRPFLFTVFPTIDELGHKGGPLSEASLAAYRAFDGYLPKLRDALAKRGDPDRTLIIATSDHGQSATHTHFDLVALVKEYAKEVLHFPFAWRHLRDCDAVSNVSGNSLAHLSFRSPTGWKERPDMTRSGTVGFDVIAALMERPEIDLVLHREDGKIRIRSKRGSALLWREGDALHYSPTDGDPFGYPEFPPVLNDDQARTLTATTEHPDGLVQWEQMFWSKRCGDVVLTATTGYDLRTHFEYQDHRGSHGSTWWEHMNVPVLMSMELPDEPLRTVDIFPTLLSAMGRPIPGPIDGRNLHNQN
ncbi:MAG: hypothetical protein ACI9OJ_004637 [Myxococcota bacterium]|jgi:hypothetical protein